MTRSRCEKKFRAGRLRRRVGWVIDGHARVDLFPKTRSVRRIPNPVSAPPSDQSRWFSEHVQPHEAALRAYLIARFPVLTDVDDLVQDTFSRVMRAQDRKSTRLNSSHQIISYAVFCLKKKRHNER